jgi:protein involved in polysaccharide export with SLBB domain
MGFFRPRAGGGLVVCGFVALAACAHGSPAPALVSSAAPSAEEAAPPGAALGPGDVFEVRVFQEPDLSGVYRVGSDGMVYFPLCGSVGVAGLQSTDVAEELEHCLAAGYLKHPQVSIYVKEFNSKKVFVLGEVQRPGTFPFDDNMTIVQAITLAGGFSPHAEKNNTSVARLVKGQEQRFKVPVVDIGTGRAPNFVLHPGDIVFVPESLF